MAKVTSSTRKLALSKGFRSGLEQLVADQLDLAGILFEYEEHKLDYVKPSKNAKYCPDFVLPNGIIIETKGRFLTDDRQKHLLVKDQHPFLDIRFVFSNSKTRLTKESKTTYAAWCVKYGFKFADRKIPQEWLEEGKKG